MDDLNDQIDKKEFPLICGGTIFKCYTFCGAGYEVSDVD